MRTTVAACLPADRPAWTAGSCSRSRAPCSATASDNDSTASVAVKDHVPPLARGCGWPAQVGDYGLTETATQGEVPGLRSYERELRTDETKLRGCRPFRSAILGEDFLCQRVPHAPP